MRKKLFMSGPWEADGPAEFFPSIMSKQGDLIATVYHSDHDGEDNITQAECGANAHLIAAAPELLEALEEASESLRSGGVVILADKYDAVLAKAYGDKP